ncbi:MAG: polysaccharide deacetylase family protein [Abditibacteriales bacterium]|nr:polysaccharide deacetylase family protein [Abditibacteriales bacterium]MDW8366659.1 polysaccharide deacetylase family protein [Abditibacteriales bacterium]
MKSLVKRVLCAALVRSGLLGPLARRARAKEGRGRAIVLYYHRVLPSDDATFQPLLQLDGAPVTVEVFERQMHYVAQHHTVVNLDWLVAQFEAGKPLTDDYVAITFDDGYEDNYLYAAPILRRYNLPWTVYVATGYIGSDAVPWWDAVNESVLSCSEEQLQEVAAWLQVSSPTRSAVIKKLIRLEKELDAPQWERTRHELARRVNGAANNAAPRYRMMTWQQVQELSANGVDIGGHTVTHPLLTKIPWDEARREVAGAKRQIEEHTGREVTGFAYPLGDFNADVQRIVAECGYRHACSTVQGTNALGADVYALKRFGITDWARDARGEFSMDLFALELSLLPIRVWRGH